MRSRKASLVLMLVGLVAVLALSGGCDDGEKSSTPTATPPRATASPAVTPSPLPDIGTLDLRSQPDVRDFAQRLGGEVAPEEVVYADLTGDGLDDAVVPVSSGGTQGDVGFIVLGYLGGKLKALLSEAPSEGEVRVAVTNGRLIETLPVYTEGDAPSFPSNIKNIYYAWRGDHFGVDHEEVVANPNPPPRGH